MFKNSFLPSGAFLRLAVAADIIGEIYCEERKDNHPGHRQNHKHDLSCHSQR